MRLSLPSVAAVALAAPAVFASYVHDNKVETVKTTVLENGQVIDWIQRDSQGNVAIPPSASAGQYHPAVSQALSAFTSENAGPPGTVPILRSTGKKLAMKVPPSVGMKPKSRIEQRGYAGQHWYASTAQSGSNHGTSATISMFNAYVQSYDDFSLLQTAVERNGVPGVGGSRLETVEAGWINYPDQRTNPHLFTFFTANGHQAYGDNVCSWNTDYKGWVQYDNSYYPGMELTPYSVAGGDQHEFALTVRLTGGNWWIGINGKWIGYYPANMFTRNGNSASQTLESGSDQINWYGEIYQSQDDLTTTDMGSGHFANEGYGKAAYIRSIAVLNTSDQNQNYDGSQGQSVSDTNRYTLDPHYNSGDANWGSYFFLGGPGAGGVIGG